MVLEIARFRIQPGKADEFVAAYRQARELLAATEGFRSARMTRGVESPDEFVLVVDWETLEAHTVNFRESDRFPQWRALIGPFFDGDPTVGALDRGLTHRVPALSGRTRISHNV